MGGRGVNEALVEREKNTEAVGGSEGMGDCETVGVARGEAVGAATDCVATNGVKEKELEGVDDPDSEK